VVCPVALLRARGEYREACRARPSGDRWTRQGFIEATSGNVVDYSAIEQRILADAALFQVKEIANDPWNATHIGLRLQDEDAIVMVFGAKSIPGPTGCAHGCPGGVAPRVLAVPLFERQR
jgi:hypothetical protein